MFSVQHCPGCFGGVSSFVLASSLGAGAVVVLIGKETEAGRGEVVCPKHTSDKWSKI